ncbi:hypothetical protein AMTR_s00026p00242870 [Amborella trichopoda]|uniref:protein-serine/threonine phosphatase n=1 Tax=Amborella trichopoda TaxID=13333 RepID=W1PT43_AMBTC|nr:hypothetical protein AMTR_s00026p00242870 [Amborella trichopoda]
MHGWFDKNTLGNLPSSKEKKVEIGDSMKERQVKPKDGAVLGSDMKFDSNINANVSTAVRPGSSNRGDAMLPNLGNITSLPDLIKDIVTNPNMILQLFQRDQQRLGALQKHVNPLPQNLSSSSSTFTMMQLSTGAPLSMRSMKEVVGKSRMKLRDPRRILHTNLIPTNVSSTPQPKPSGTEPSTAVGSLEFENPVLEVLDDKQRQAIKKERARRIEEHNKMFSAQKLSLVLDLDHTLLNSAKFIEVDQNHDQILKKTEKQDRLKPRRHLYRFPHMGMWTKL